MKVRQQVVRQIGEQDEPFLGRETSLSSCCQAQTALVAAKLLYFGTSTAVVASQKMAFGGQGKSGNVVTMAELAIFEPPFDKNAHWATIVNGWRDLAQPDVAIGIPTTDLLGQSTSPTV